LPGVRRVLAHVPSSLILLREQALLSANHQCESLEMQIYGFDPTMAPEGKGVIKVELVSSYSYWKELYADKERYAAEKQKIASQVISLLEKPFPGISGQIEVLDVPTLMTWERFLDESHGWLNFPNKKFSIGAAVGARGGQASLPGLANFYFAGAWASALGALFGNAISGRNAIRAICRKDGKKFIAPQS